MRLDYAWLLPGSTPTDGSAKVEDCIRTDAFDWNLREPNHPGRPYALKLLMVYTGYRTLGHLRHAMEVDPNLHLAFVSIAQLLIYGS